MRLEVEEEFFNLWIWFGVVLFMSLDINLSFGLFEMNYLELLFLGGLGGELGCIL